MIILIILGVLPGSPVHDLLGYGEDPRLAGDEQEAVMGLAAEPTRPVKAAIVEGTIKTVTRQRL
jgi:hypothetical protein